MKFSNQEWLFEQSFQDVLIGLINGFEVIKFSSHSQLIYIEAPARHQQSSIWGGDRNDVLDNQVQDLKILLVSQSGSLLSLLAIIKRNSIG